MNVALLRAGNAMTYFLLRDIFNDHAEAQQSIVMEEVYEFFNELSKEDTCYESLLKDAKIEFCEGNYAQDTCDLALLRISNYLKEKNQERNTIMRDFLEEIVGDYFEQAKKTINLDGLTALIESGWGEDEEDARAYAFIIEANVPQMLRYEFITREFFFDRYNSVKSYEELAEELLSEEAIDDDYIKELTNAIDDGSVDYFLIEQGWRINSIEGGAIGIDFEELLNCMLADKTTVKNIGENTFKICNLALMSDLEKIALIESLGVYVRTVDNGYILTDPLIRKVGTDGAFYGTIIDMIDVLADYWCSRNILFENEEVPSAAPSISFVFETQQGALKCATSTDPEYPGVYVELLSEDGYCDNTVLIERSYDENEWHCYIWAKKDTEDFTHKITLV